VVVVVEVVVGVGVDGVGGDGRGVEELVLVEGFLERALRGGLVWCSRGGMRRSRTVAGSHRAPRDGH